MDFFLKKELEKGINTKFTESIREGPCEMIKLVILISTSDIMVWAYAGNTGPFLDDNNYR